MSNNTMNFVELEGTKKTTSTKMLAGTAQLTNVASTIVNGVMDAIQADFENKRELFEASKADHGAMDTLLDETYDLSSVDISFLKELDEDVLMGILKSQQSKRSRAKGKPMTVDNYKNMMNGAVSEGLVRLALNKPRATNNIGFNGKSILEYSPEEIQALANDQEALRRMIRNVQSQKCIMSHKDTFDELDEKYQALLKVEAVLKDLRVAAPRKQNDKTKKALKEMLADSDIDGLKAADSKDLLKQIMALIDDEESEDTNVEEVTEDAE